MKIVAIVVGLLTGIISGFGVGGGSLLILYLTTVVGIGQSQAAGINLLYFLFCAPTALISHIRQKRIRWDAVWICAVSGIAASVAAALLSPYLSSDWLRRLFGVLLLYVGIKECVYRNNKKKRTSS